VTEVTLYTRRGCRLCEDAAEELRRLGKRYGFALVERDIDGDAALRERYNDVIPVIAIAERIIASAPLDLLALEDAVAEALVSA
jgi:hypothetical protein